MKIRFKRNRSTIHFVQDNQPFSSKGALRGLHYQVGEHSQNELVRVLSGEGLMLQLILDLIQKTFESMSVLLTADNQTQFFVPRGFAHGFFCIERQLLFLQM